MTHHSDRDRWASPSALEPRLSWGGILRVALLQLGGTASVRALNVKLERELFPKTHLSSQSKLLIRAALMGDPAIQQISKKVWRLRESEDARLS